MGIISWVASNWRFVGAILLAAALAWGATLVKGKFDRAAEADRIEAQAARQVADAKAELEQTAAQLQALKDDVKRTDAARAIVDNQVHEREEGYVSIIETLKARVAKASPQSVAGCAYDGAGARGVLNAAWAGRAPPPVPDAAGTPH